MASKLSAISGFRFLSAKDAKDAKISKLGRLSAIGGDIAS